MAKCLNVNCVFHTHEDSCMLDEVSTSFEADGRDVTNECVGRIDETHNLSHIAKKQKKGEDDA